MYKVIHELSLGGKIDDFKPKTVASRGLSATAQHSCKHVPSFFKFMVCSVDTVSHNNKKYINKNQEQQIAQL